MEPQGSASRTLGMTKREKRLILHPLAAFCGVTDHAKAQGALLGKVRSALKEGSGLVQVLVSLQ